MVAGICVWSSGAKFVCVSASSSMSNLHNMRSDRHHDKNNETYVKLVTRK